MPKVTVELNVDHVERPQPPFGGRVYLTDVSDFWRIAELGFPELQDVGRGNPGGRIKIQCPEQDDRWLRAVEIIERHGFKLASNMAVGQGTNLFHVYRNRVYDAVEIEEAPLLHAHPRCADQIMADWGYGGDNETGWIAQANGRFAKKLSFGRLDSLPVMIFDEELKAVLENENLIGLDFIPVKFDRPDKAKRALWQLAQTHKMPPCLLPRVTQRREPYAGDNSFGALWDEGGYSPMELRFNHAQVHEMGQFDIATSREKIGSNEKMMQTEVVVSQRFREVMQKLKIKGLEYIPVRLV